MLKVLIKTNPYFTMVYKTTDAKPALVAGDVVGKLRAAEEEITEADYLTIDETKLNNYSWTGENVSADGYPINFPADAITLKDGLSASNYDLQIEARTMKITAASIETGGKFAFTTNYTAPYTYSAAEQKPTFGITWNHDGDDGTTPAITLVEGTDYEWVYKADGVEVENPTDAATYNVFVKGLNNYSGAEVAVADNDFVINKAELIVIPIEQNKEYDGAPFNRLTAQFNISGRVGADATKPVNGLAAKEVDAFAKDVASYTVGVDASTATIGVAPNIVALNKNYNINTTPVTVEWEIEKKDLTIDVSNVTMNVGGDEPNLADGDVASFTVTGAVDNTEKTAIEELYTLAWANAAEEPLEGKTFATLPVGTIEKAVKTNTPVDAVLNNYDITINRGNLIVKGANFAIMPTVASEIEYGDVYTIGYYTTGEIDESKLVFVIGETEYAYANKDKKAGEEGAWVLPTERGNYNVTIKAGTAVGKGASLGGEAVPMATAFNIVPKTLTLTVKNQTVHKNDPITILDELVAGNEGADGITIAEDLAFEDKIADLGLTYSLDETLVTIEGGKITSGEGDIANAILVTLGNENYALKGGAYTKGKLTVSTAFSADLAAATAAATIAEGAANGSEYDVTISGRTLTGGKFNVMVLPFEVNTYDFCQAIGGYAIFNRLVSVEGDDVKFALELDKIPANEPFIVKPLADVDFDDMNDNGTPDSTDDHKNIVFSGVTFVEPAADPVVYDAITGAEFIGTYTAAIDLPADSYGMQGGAFKHFNDAKANAVKFTRAYIKLASGSSSARFFVEEPGENGATAIKSLNVNTMESVDMDGWYTVGGIKLQGAPTEKGVYINNGKKVVIK